MRRSPSDSDETLTQEARLGPQKPIMALARCDECGQARSRKKTYPHRHDPLSYPNSDVICGSQDCENPAHIWPD